jgi:hypothetical protein
LKREDPSGSGLKRKDVGLLTYPGRVGGLAGSLSARYLLPKLKFLGILSPGIGFHSGPALSSLAHHGAPSR